MPLSLRWEVACGGCNGGDGHAGRVSKAVKHNENDPKIGRCCIKLLLTESVHLALDEPQDNSEISQHAVVL